LAQERWAVPYETLESRRVYQRAEALADRVWEMIVPWEWFARRTIGVQLARAADPIGANVAEAGGRFHPADVRNFLYYARGSLRETKYWLRRTGQRGLASPEQVAQLDEELEQLSREINECIKFQRTRRSGGR
jgi:four helix bundle protein